MILLHLTQTEHYREIWQPLMNLHWTLTGHQFSLSVRQRVGAREYWGMILCVCIFISEFPLQISTVELCWVIWASFHPHWSKVKSYPILLLFFWLRKNCTDRTDTWMQCKKTNQNQSLCITVHYSSVNVILKTEINHNLTKENILIRFSTSETTTPFSWTYNIAANFTNLQDKINSCPFPTEYHYEMHHIMEVKYDANIILCRLHLNLSEQKC